jgi:hypothetical protein
MKLAKSTGWWERDGWMSCKAAMLAQEVINGASDVHIEPQEDCVLLHY